MVFRECTHGQPNTAPEKAFGGRVVIQYRNGKIIEEELAVAHAHCNGKRPFARANYEHKFDTLTAGLVQPKERTRFFELCERLPTVSAGELGQLNLQLDDELIDVTQRNSEGIF